MSTAPGASAFRFPQERPATMDELRFMAHKVAQVHGFSHPAMIELSAVVDALADALIRPSMASASVSLTSVNLAEQPADTDSARKAWDRAGELTEGYTPWEGACGTVNRLFAGLKEHRSLN